MAKKCIETARSPESSPNLRGKAWDRCREYLAQAEGDLRKALEYVKNQTDRDYIEKDLEFLSTMKAFAQRPPMRPKGPAWRGHRGSRYSWSFSHFFLWRAFHLQLDCGEGAAIRLDDHVFRAEVLALSHGHADHCRGLIGLLDARAGLKGANDTALTILYPKQSALMADWIREAESFTARRGMAAVAFRAMDDGDA